MQAEPKLRWQMKFSCERKSGELTSSFVFNGIFVVFRLFSSFRTFDRFPRWISFSFVRFQLLSLSLSALSLSLVTDFRPFTLRGETKMPLITVLVCVQGPRGRERKEEREKERREGGNKNQWAYWDGEQWIKVKTLYLVFLFFYSLFLSLFFSSLTLFLSSSSIFYFFFSFSWIEAIIVVIFLWRQKIRWVLFESLSPLSLSFWFSSKVTQSLKKQEERKLCLKKGREKQKKESDIRCLKMGKRNMIDTIFDTLTNGPFFSSPLSRSFIPFHEHEFPPTLASSFSFSFSYVWFNLHPLLNHHRYKYWQ